MAGQIKLFEKFDGLLREIAPDQAETMRLGRRYSRMALEIDILWDPGEEAAADAELAAVLERKMTAAAVREQTAAAAIEKRTLLFKKLDSLGIDLDDLKAALA